MDVAGGSLCLQPAQQSRRIHTPDVSLMMEVRATYHPSFRVFAAVHDAAYGENFTSRSPGLAVSSYAKFIYGNSKWVSRDLSISIEELDEQRNMGERSVPPADSRARSPERVYLSHSFRSSEKHVFRSGGIACAGRIDRNREKRQYPRRCAMCACARSWPIAAN
jgi:hypothetical protein